MATEITMPQLSDTMDSGKIITWNKSEGDTIQRGDILAEVETDKANLEIESFHNGTLLKITTPAGSAANVGAVIAYIGDAAEKIAAPSNSNTTKLETEKLEMVPEPETSIPLKSEERNLDPSASETQIVRDDDRIKISPLAKKIAKQKNIDLSVVEGSGPNGRIVKRDIDAAAKSTGTVTQSSQTTAKPYMSNTIDSASKAPSGGLTPLSKMRETIARRMQQSVNESPHFYTSVSIEMDEALRTRKALKAIDKYSDLSVNHLIIKAAAYALSKEPRVNCAMKDEQLYNPGQINIGVITAIEDGLLIPVIKEADKLSLSDLAFEARAAIERARAGRPNAQDLVGGTFSISNMGMFEVEHFTAIINPGQGAVLAVSSSKPTPVVKDGVVVVRNIMQTTLSVDHRIIDGIMSANFLKHFKQALEIPALLV
ncbi:MAG: dihydrolipoamide acetyltransferase family protein [Bdellovibrionota bacterium]